jgi:adenine-specific DNA methylase
MKRLIEVDLPIKAISAHARREKSIRHGHISTLHIWWARRPLAACRAVLCAALWLDPADKECPQSFRVAVAEILVEFARAARNDKNLKALCVVGKDCWNRADRASLNPNNEAVYWDMRQMLLAFIADFANWDASTYPTFLDAARALTKAAHLAEGGEVDTLPLVVDPFAGGGSIPLEALRIGADAYASDLNPVAVLLNKVVLEYIPKYGQRLADEVRKWGEVIKQQAQQELAEFYPIDEDGATPIAYLWARTVMCEGCGAEVPLMRSLWLAKKAKKSVALKLSPRLESKPSDLDISIIENATAKDVGDGTVKRGNATCPCCGYTTPVTSVRKQLKARKGGGADARLVCVVTTRKGEQGRFYRLPTEKDLQAVRETVMALKQRLLVHSEELSLIPDEDAPPQGALSCRNAIYGMEQWGDLFTPRQLLALTTLARLVRELPKSKDLDSSLESKSSDLDEAVQTCLALAVDRQADYLTSLTIWANTGEFIAHTFGRQALPIVWEYPECNPWGDGSGNWEGAINWIKLVIEANIFKSNGIGQTESANAAKHPLPDEIAQVFFTDPPYFDSINYSNISDFFYVWLKRTVGQLYPNLFKSVLTDKENECVVNPIIDRDSSRYGKLLKQAMSEGCRILVENGIGMIVFAHKSTVGWENLLQAMIDSGWIITASWPIDTERGARVNARGTASLASSIHLVCRKRQSRPDNMGNYRNVLAELAPRIQEWMPRLTQEGIVGADAIFACLGPAMEIYSRYDRVEKADGTVITLQDYLEQVWATVSKEALRMIFKEADATGFEEDARLTAIWLWTLSTATAANDSLGDQEEEDSGEDEEETLKKPKTRGYLLEFDAARKIAQGLGVHLDNLSSLIEIKRGEARLLPVTERATYLLGSNLPAALTKKVAKKSPKPKQFTLTSVVAETEENEDNHPDHTPPDAGQTTLDRVHQSLLLFGLGRSEALKRFLVETIGKDGPFWQLTNALSALYPKQSDEKRWIDGVLARKKSLQI